MREIPWHVVVLGREAALLGERLAAPPGWTQRFAALGAFLLARLAEAPAPRPDIRHAWDRLAGADGAVAIGALCDELGCSRLASRFGGRSGSGRRRWPSAALHCAVERVRAGDDLAGVAAACGYYDRSHLTREFGGARRPAARGAPAQAPLGPGVAVAVAGVIP